MNFDSFGWKEVWKLLTPLDQNHGLPVEDFLQPQGRDLRSRVQPVQVHVKDAPSSVLVDQREGRTGDFLGLCRALSADDALGESGLSRAQVADEQHDGAFRKLARDLAPQFDGLFFGARFKRSHESP